MKRRTFLGSAAGLLCLPLLESLEARAASGEAPRRIILLYNPNGTYPEQWFPTDVKSPTDFTLGKIHQPLAAFKDRLTLVRGVHQTAALDPENNGGPHQRGIGALFTGQFLQTGDFKDGCGKTAGWAAGPSIDQSVAELVGTDTPLRSLELGVRCFDNDVQGRISYAGAGLPLPPMNNPRDTYDRLFFRADPLDPNDPGARQASILDAVKGQFNALNRKVGTADREKLARHLDLVRDLERRLGVGTGPVTEECKSPPLPKELDANSEGDMPQVSADQIDLLAMAFACDLVRVASIQYSTGFNRIRYPFAGSDAEGHTLSHSGDSNTAAWEELGRRAAWHSEQLARLMTRLSEIPEGDGTVLDNTLIIWGNEVSKGNSHALTDIPYLLAGSAGGAFKTGQFLDYTAGGGKSGNDLLLTVLRGFGGDAATFGHPGHSSGELSGLLA